MLIFKGLAAPLVAFILFSTGMLAQSTAPQMWQGTLRNAAGAPIHGAAIHLRNKNSQLDATTDSDGRFRFQGVAAGPYRLSVEANHRKVQYSEPVDIKSEDRKSVV